MSFIKKLQTKPYAVRVRILWASVVIVMSIIFIAWLFFLTSHTFLSTGTNLEQNLEQKQEAIKIPSLFGTIKEDISNLKNLLQATVKNMTENGKREEMGGELEFKVIR